MADKSAHLTAFSQIKPSIFDYLAQDGLNDLLNPAIKRLVAFFCAKYPENGFLLKYFEENYLLSTSLVQYFYLKKHGATFAEHIYGLTRVPALGGPRPLNKKEIVLSILTVVLVPYLRRKLNDLAEEEYFSNASSKNKVKKEAILKLNSALQIAIQLANFVQHLRFLGGKSEYNSPLLWLIGLKLSFSDETQNMTWRNMVLMAVQRGFELGAFFLQCYEGWKSESRGLFGALPAPPPPEISQDEIEYAGICPLCRGVRQVETALSVSGLVFCFGCIQKYLNQHRQCPITKLPASFEDLIRLYPAGS